MPRLRGEFGTNLRVTGCIGHSVSAGGKMQAPEVLIKTNMQVISKDGKRVGYVQRLTDAEIITAHPYRHIPFSSIRRVTDDVYVGLRYEDIEARHDDISQRRQLRASA
jgi:hypothetical protein